MKLGPCTKCGWPFSANVRPLIRTFNLDSGPKYCSKCGASLWETCAACNGTGRKGGPLGIGVDKYCSECGRELNIQCPRCNGEGKIKSHHICLKF